MATIINAWNISAKESVFRNNWTPVNINCNNITWIDQNASNAFRNCHYLKRVRGLSIAITNMVNAYHGCPALKQAELPPNITSIRDTFHNCSNIEQSPTIPANVTDMVHAYTNSGIKNMPAIPNKVTNMYEAFMNCYRLTGITHIPNSVTNMCRTFYNSGLVQGVNIPNSVTNLDEVYKDSKNLTDGGTLPRTNSLTNTYYGCSALVNAPVIPNSVTTMKDTFHLCTHLVNAPVIPSSVTNMFGTFADCYNLVNMPAIPNSVTHLDYTFSQCAKLSNIVAIPLSVRSMKHTFNACSNLPSTFMILSKDITNANGCFNGTSNVRKDIFMPFQYINNTYTPTYNAFVAAGYSTTDYSKDNTRIHDMDIANVTVYPVPTDANVIFNAPGYTQSGHMITVRKKSDTFPGVQVDWVVNRWGYRNESGSLVPEKDVRINVTMQKLPFTFTIVPSPADATVTLTADGYTQEGNSIRVLYQTNVHWKVEKEGYFIQEGDITVEDTIDFPITLIRTHYNVTVTSLTSGATVTLSVQDHPEILQSGNSIIAPYMGIVTWTVAKNGYKTETGTIDSIAEDTELSIKLIKPNDIIFESTTPNSYSIAIPETGYYEVAAVGAGGGGAAVADQPKYHYKSGSSGGGSGAYIRANILLEGGVEYPAAIGAGGAGSGGSWGSQRTGGTGGNSLFGDFLTCNGGTGGYARWTDGSPSDCRAGVGGSFEYNGDIRVINSSNGKNGAIKNNGYGSVSGGASVFDSYGAGGNAGTSNTYGSATSGGNGYLFVRMVSPEIIIERSTAGTQEIVIPVTGKYQVIMVGGGGGGGYASNGFEYYYSAAGGQAAMIEGTATIQAGTYTITVGGAGAGGGDGYGGNGKDGGDTIFNGNIAGGGKGAKVAEYYGEKHDGYGGTAIVITGGLTGTNGQQGKTSGIYDDYGAGGVKGNNAGKGGYIKIIYLGE